MFFRLSCIALPFQLKAGFPGFELFFCGAATVDDVLLVTITYRPSRGAKLVFDYEIRKESDNSLVLTAETTQLFTNLRGELEASCPEFLTEWKKKHQLC